jgi:hypothetical protein
MASLMPNGKQQYFTALGQPLIGGKVYTYAAGTTTPKATFSDVGGTTPNPNPITLDARGEALIYWSGNYKIDVQDTTGVSLTGYPVDNCASIDSQISTSIAALVTSLAASTGAALVGWIQSVAGAVLRTVADKLTDQVSIFDFMTTAQIADVRAGTALVDVTAPLQAACNWLNSGVIRRKLVFPAGRYKYSVSPNWAIQDVEIVAEGNVYLRYTGTDNAVIIDGQIIVGGLYNMRMGHTNQFIVEAPSTAKNGVYCRNVLQGCHFGFRVVGAGATYAGLRVEYAVAAIFDFMCSVSGNNNAWYSQPAYGMYLTKNQNIGDPCSYCTFNTPICETINGTGIYLDYAYGNSFFGGTSEQNTSVGIYLTANAHENKFYSVDMEANVNHDIYCLGYRNSFVSVDTLTQVTFDGTAVNNVLLGGTHSKITINASCANNIISGAGYNRNADGSTITDSSGGKTRLRDNINIGAGRVENSPPISGIPITIGASPFTFTNTTVNEELVVISGTGITQVVIVRNGVPTVASGAPGQFLLCPADAIQLYYSGGTQIMTMFPK